MSTTLLIIIAVGVVLAILITPLICGSGKRSVTCWYPSSVVAVTNQFGRTQIYYMEFMKGLTMDQLMQIAGYYALSEYKIDVVFGWVVSELDSMRHNTEIKCYYVDPDRVAVMVPRVLEYARRIYRAVSNKASPTAFWVYRAINSRMRLFFFVRYLQKVLPFLPDNLQPKVRELFWLMKEIDAKLFTDKFMGLVGLPSRQA